LAYYIRYSSAAEAHVRALSARDRAAVADRVEQQLAHQPTTETRNRKRMRPNPVAPWEFRIGDLRVYYQVTDSPEPIVDVLAVGQKAGNRVIIGGEEVDL